eukprot:m.18564 g.18564  ORF g.18564 m.18564 type:complete len:379 (+) comp27678_c0_seq2:291-1427(+)
MQTGYSYRSTMLFNFVLRSVIPLLMLTSFLHVQAVSSKSRRRCSSPDKQTGYRIELESSVEIQEGQGVHIRCRLNTSGHPVPVSTSALEWRTPEGNLIPPKASSLQNSKLYVDQGAVGQDPVADLVINNFTADMAGHYWCFCRLSHDSVKTVNVTFPDCGEPLAPWNGKHASKPSSINRLGTEIISYCNEGYQKDPSSADLKQTCGKDGKWHPRIDELDTICKRKRCGQPKLNNGTYGACTYSSDFVGSTSDCHCRQGYTTAEGNDFFQLHCTNDSSWADPPDCYENSEENCGCSKPRSRDNDNATWKIRLDKQNLKPHSTKKNMLCKGTVMKIACRKPTPGKPSKRSKKITATCNGKEWVADKANLGCTWPKFLSRN